MSIKMVLFDLDGTLLPMDQDVFVKSYFGRLAEKLVPYGYDSQQLFKAIWSGTGAMVKNTGKKRNEHPLWDTFAGVFGEKVREDLPVFEDFYHNEFNGVQQDCGYAPQAAQTVRRIKEMGLRVALATNPLFPAVATRNRIRWAGLVPEDFELYTTYENSSYCKPNPDYYLEVIGKLRVKPEECLMVGNDVAEDMIARKLGMEVFLLTDCLINKNEEDISAYPHGGFTELGAFLDKIARD